MTSTSSSDLQKQEERKDPSIHLAHLTEALIFLNGLRQDSSTSFGKSIDARQSRIKEAEDQLLFAWINQSDELLWQTHPSFYHALIAELRTRNLIPTTTN